jgi:hypothetical protein
MFNHSFKAILAPWRLKQNEIVGDLEAVFHILLSH